MTRAYLFPDYYMPLDGVPQPRPVTVDTMDQIHDLLGGRSQSVGADTWTAYLLANGSELVDQCDVNAEATVFLNRNHPTDRFEVLGPMVLTGPELGDDLPAGIAHQIATAYRPSKGPAAELAAVWTPDTFYRIIDRLDLRESLALTNALPAILPRP